MTLSGLPFLGRSLCLALALALAAGLASAATTQLVVIDKSLPSESGLTSPQLSMLGDAIRGEAAETLRSRGVQVMTEETTLMLLEQSSVDLSQCEGECEVETARNMRADWLITSKVVRFGNQFSLSLNLIHSESASVMGSKTLVVERMEELATLAVEGTRYLCQRTGLLDAPSESASSRTSQDRWQPQSSLGVLVVFESTPSGALVSVDGRFIGECPVTEEIPSGLHDVEWTLNYYETERRTERVEKRCTIAATLNPIYSQLSVTSEPTQMPVWVDARYMGETPLDHITMGHGSHRVVVGDSSWTQVQERRVNLTKGQHETIHVEVPLRQGRLIVRAYDDLNNAVVAPVHVETVLVGETPLEVMLPVGDFTVYVMDQSRDVRIREKQDTVLRFNEGGEVSGDEEPVLKAGVFYGLHFITLGPGRFTMGSPESEMDREADEITHEVELSAFAMLSTEVTQELWVEVMGSNPSTFKGDQHPVENVSWEDVQLFLNRLNAMEPGMNYRLPTEAEWEYASRGGGGGPWSSGRSAVLVGDHAWFRANANAQTQVVGSLEHNAWGLYDMMGNVWEWCSDWYDVYDTRTPRNPRGGADGERRVVRGGAWNSAPSALRCANRSGNRPDLGNSSLGFRLCRKPQ